MPTPPTWFQVDYAGALASLLPPGKVWPRDADSTIYQVLMGIAASNQVSNSRANTLLRVAFPATAEGLLEEWEATLGLPGRFGYTGGDFATRQRQIVAALTDSGGQSIPFFVEKASQMGFSISIEQFTVHHVGSDVDFALYDAAWAFAFQVDVAIGTVTTALAAMLTAYKPAHTTYFFKFV